MKKPKFMKEEEITLENINPMAAAEYETLRTIPLDKLKSVVKHSDLFIKEQKECFISSKQLRNINIRVRNNYLYLNDINTELYFYEVDTVKQTVSYFLEEEDKFINTIREAVYKKTNINKKTQPKGE